MDVLSGTTEHIIDRQLGEIVAGVRDFETRLRELELRGNSPLRAAYIINNQERGRNRKAMKRWARGRRDWAVRVDRICGDTIRRRINPYSNG